MSDYEVAFATGSEELTRKCGKCTMCCTVMSVDELEKPMWSRCTDLSVTRGCSRYDTRPDGCRHFECMWRRGLGSGRARPDKCGVMFVLSADGYVLVALVDAKKPNEWKKGEAARVIQEYLGRGVPVFVASPKHREALMPSFSALSPTELEERRASFMAGDWTY